MLRTRFFYRDYILENVYQSMSEQIREEVIRFWLTHRALSKEIAEQRVHQVVFIIRSKRGDIIGVNTVHIRKLVDFEKPFYFYRMFIRPEDRRNLGLISFIAEQTYLFLKDYEYNPRPEGIVMIMENPKFYRKGIRRWLQRKGLRYYGKNLRGQDVWYIRF